MTRFFARHTWSYIFIAPTLAFFALFTLIPVLQAFALSLQNATIVGGTFVGFELAIHLLGLRHGLRDGTNIFNKKLCERSKRPIFQGDDPDRVSRIGVMAQSSSPEDRAAFSFMVAKVYAQAGDFDRSLEYLRKAMEEGYKDIRKVYTDSEFATLRTDKRFEELMSQKPQPIP